MNQKLLIALAGDWHGNTMYAVRALRHAAAQGAKLVIQLGDFGYYPPQDIHYHYTENDEVHRETTWDAYGSKVVHILNAEAERLDLMLWFIDGNHDNHDALALLTPEEHGRCVLAPHVHYVPRGYRHTFDGHEWLFLGGANSIDRIFWQEGTEWFPQEVLTRENVETCVAAGPAEVLLCHEAPNSIPHIRKTYSTLPEGTGWLPEDFEKSLEGRALLDEVMEGCQVQKVYHGHYHDAYEQEYEWHGRQRYAQGLHRDGRFFHQNILLVDAAGNPVR